MRRGPPRANQWTRSPPLHPYKEPAMSINVTQTNPYADLGDVWLRYQRARIQQRHLQIGQHFRCEVDALLARVARATRAVGAIETRRPVQNHQPESRENARLRPVAIAM